MGTKGETMTVYTNTKRKQNDEIEQFLSRLAKETSAANLLSKDLTKYGCRMFHLFEAEVINKFDIPLKETYQLVFKFFKKEELFIDVSKSTFTSDIFDYPILGRTK